MNVSLKKILRPIYHWSRIIYRINWFKTLYINFKTLPFSVAKKMPIIIYGSVDFDALNGKVIINSKVYFGMIQIGKDIDDMPIASNSAKIRISGVIEFYGFCIINSGSNITVESNSLMKIGNHVMIGSGVLIKSLNYIEIGDYTRIASGCFILDSNMHSVRNVVTGEIKRKDAPIKIGKYCWITMNTSIMSSTVLPDYCITARNTLLNKDYSMICKKGSMLAGSPAKVVADSLQRIYDYSLERKITRYFKDNPNSLIYIGEKGFIEEPNFVHSDFKLF